MADDRVIYDVLDPDSPGRNVPAGRVGLYRDSITLQNGEQIRLDGVLSPKESAGLVAHGPSPQEPHLGIVTAPSDVYEVTLTCPTDAQDAGDVICATQELLNCVRVPGGTGILQSVTLLDPSDQGIAIDLFLFRSNVALGTEDAAISISDANAIELLTVVSIAGSDYVDLINSQVAIKTSIGAAVKAVAGSRNLYIAAASTAGGTWASGSFTLKLGFLWD